MGIDIRSLAIDDNRQRIVHEYHSLSTPPFAKLKDRAKRLLNRQPNGRIFLNDRVRDALDFRDSVPSITREMGFDKGFLAPSCSSKDFDIVYCGSINNRSGLVDTLLRLDRMGLRILVIGECDAKIAARASDFQNVIFTGRLSREEVFREIKRARFGLNYTPDIAPFNFQTSTKTLEYIAAGLGVISNRYAWAYEFSRARNIHFLWLDENFRVRDLEEFKFPRVDISDLEWDAVLARAGLDRFLTSLLP